MSEAKRTSAIPKSSLRYLMLCAGGVALLVFLGILPMAYMLNSLDDKIVDLKYRLEEQQNLTPIYQALQKRMEEKKIPTLLPMPGRTKLSRTQLDQVPATIGGLARAAQLEVMTIAQDLGSLGADAKQAPVRVVVRGSLPQFRNFYTAMGGLSYVDRFDSVEVRPTPTALEMKMSLLVALN